MLRHASPFQPNEFSLWSPYFGHWVRLAFLCWYSVLRSKYICAASLEVIRRPWSVDRAGPTCPQNLFPVNQRYFYSRPAELLLFRWDLTALRLSSWTRRELLRFHHGKLRFINFGSWLICSPSWEGEFEGASVAISVFESFVQCWALPAPLPRCPNPFKSWFCLKSGLKLKQMMLNFASFVA